MLTPLAESFKPQRCQRTVVTRGGPKTGKCKAMYKFLLMASRLKLCPPYLSGQRFPGLRSLSVLGVELESNAEKDGITTFTPVYGRVNGHQKRKKLLLKSTRYSVIGGWKSQDFCRDELKMPPRITGMRAWPDESSLQMSLLQQRLRCLNLRVLLLL